MLRKIEVFEGLLIFLRIVLKGKETKREKSLRLTFLGRSPSDVVKLRLKTVGFSPEKA